MIRSIAQFRWNLGATLLVLPVLSVLWAEANQGSTQPETDAVRQVRSLLERQEADWNRGDLDAFMTGYWKSPKLVFQSGGERFDGWEAMRERYFRRYKAEGKAMGRLGFVGIEFEPLGPEAVLVRGGWRLSLPDGTTPGGLFTLIFRNFTDGWKIIHDHTSAETQSRPKSS
jgi:ketosteroid isomerase-like protein